MSFGEVTQTLWRRKLIVLLVFAAVLASGVLFLSKQQKVYEARSTVVLLPNSRDPIVTSVYSGLIDKLLPTYSQIVKSRSFLDKVAGRLPDTPDGSQLGASVFAEPVGGAAALRIVAHSGNASRAAQVARAATTAFGDELADDTVVRVRVIDTARTPVGPVAPRPKLVLFATLVMATFLSLGAGIAWDRLFGRVHDSRELAEASGLPVIGVIPEERRLKAGRRIVMGDSEFPHLEESLRSIRTNLMFAIGASDLRSVMISGLNPQDGKSTVTANLAVAIAELGFQVLLVDADVHRPSQHELFGLSNARGLTSTVLSNADPASLVQTTRYPGVRVVTSGPPLANRAQEVDVYLQFLPRFARLADVVLLDSPPLRAADDVRLLAAAAGGVVLLVRAGAARARQVKAGVDSLQVLDARILGTVLTRANETGMLGNNVGYYTYRQTEGEPAS